MGSAILDMNEGKVAAVVSDLAAWWVEGIAGGLYEGIGEGMALLGVNAVSNRSSGSSEAGSNAGAGSSATVSLTKTKTEG